MIYLHVPPSPGWNRIQNMSPFCLKMEAWLRIAKIPYKIRAPDFRKAPKGKIPYIVDDARNLVMGDSGLIIDDLKKTYNISIDDQLTEEQKATSVLIQRTLEEHIYFAAALMRWQDEISFEHVKGFFVKILPPVVGSLIIKAIRRGILKSARQQGIGRHTRSEMLKLCYDDLDAISAILGSHEFIHGDRPTSIDACVYGFMANIMWVPWDNELKSYAASKPNLVAFTERFHKIFEAHSNVAK